MPLVEQGFDMRGRVGPAPTPLSPVARAYPSPRFRRFFHFVVRLTVLSMNKSDRATFLPKCHE
jgi:hypothetical protein